MQIRIKFQFHKFPTRFSPKFVLFSSQIFQFVYHSISLVNDFIGTNESLPENPPKIRKVRDYMFATFTFPISMNVAVVFWSLYAIDRELVFPSVMDPIYPWWLNQILHTNVFTFMVVELFLHHHVYPSRKAELLGISIFSLSYIGWVNVVKLVANAWVYPILNVLDLHHRIGFFILIGVLPMLFYFVGEFINTEVWTKRRLQHPKSH
jgi:hypothetical protein